MLAGPRFALLRPEFATLRARGRVRDGRIDRILVFISGADEPDVTSRAVVGLGLIGRPVDVVVGAPYPHLEGLREIVASQPATELHVNTDSMAVLMDRADLAVGAASSASWERCALGLPALLVTLADNQLDAERRLVEAGAAQSLGWQANVTAADVERAVQALRSDPGRVRAMSVAAADVTDGQGTARVVAEIEALVADRWRRDEREAMTTDVAAFSINGRSIGPGQPVYVIAEISSNHGQDYDAAVELVRGAHAAGADAVKLQTYTADTITIDSDAPAFTAGEGSLWEGTTLHALYETAYMPWEWQPRLKAIADELGMDCFSSPFDPTAVDFLDGDGCAGLQDRIVRAGRPPAHPQDRARPVGR